MKKNARVLYPFSPRYPDEIEVSFNNIVTITSEETEAGSEWVEVEYNGNNGKIPKSFIEQMDLYGADATILFDYSPDDESGQFLKLKKGEVIKILSYDSSGWDIGYSYANNQVGAVPHNYISINDPASAEDVKSLFFIDQLALIPVLCTAIDTSSCEAFSKDLTLLMEHNNETFNFIQTIIKEEVKNTVNEGTLFRKNNLVSYSMTAYARYIGIDYLKDTLQPLIASIANSSHSCEIDPHRVSADELEENVNTLRKISQMFFHRIMESISKVPSALKHVCNLLKTIVTEKFPTSKRKVIGGFYFLRFICPAVVSPEGFGVIDKIDPKTRRGLILISKIIQTLSNGVVFGKKEEYMIPMNSFINENLENAHYVLDRISTIHPQLDVNIERLPPLKDEDYNSIIKRLHSQLVGSMNKICNQLKQMNFPAEFHENFVNILIRFGAPVFAKIPEKPLVSQSTSNLLGSSPSSSSLTNSSEDILRLSGNSSLDKKLLEKKQKEEKKMQEKKLRDEKKQRERIKEKKKEFPMPEGSVIAEAFILRKSKGNFNTIQWIKKYYSLFSISSKIYVSNSPDDLRDNRFLGFIELFPAFSTTPIGKSKNPPGWEIRLVTNTQEHNLVFLNENDMRAWVSVLDRRLQEILLPDASLKKKEDLLQSIELKLERYNAELETIKLRLSSKAEGEEKSSDEKHFEEVLVTINDLQRTHDKVKRERDQLIQSNLLNKI